MCKTNLEHIFFKSDCINFFQMIEKFCILRSVFDFLVKICRDFLFLLMPQVEIEIMRKECGQIL